MSTPNFDEYRKINAIIENDDAASTLKYALLKGTIEICQQYSHFKEVQGDRAWYPMGLLVERWLTYFYPIFESSIFIPQLVGETNRAPSKKIVFREPFTEIISEYHENGGFSVFFSDFASGMLPPEINAKLLKVCKTIRGRIIDMPMRHLGYSLHQKEYSIFTLPKKVPIIPRNLQVSPEQLIKHFGTYSIPKDLAETFEVFGGFIIGEETLLSKWADFSLMVANNKGIPLDRGEILSLLLKEPETERNVTQVKQFYSNLLKEQGSLSCVWSGKNIKSMKNIDIDHILPFSVWKNNDLWNLMPSDSKCNALKRDNIPSLDLLDRRRESIIKYWIQLHDEFGRTFENEMKLALLGEINFPSDWKIKGFNQLKKKCAHLIGPRGLVAWNP
jgi:hypothetical protein